MGKMEKIDAALGTSIRHYRWLHGVPLADLAAALGISEAQLRSHEAGKSSISAARLMDISRHLGLDVTTFFKRVSPDAAHTTAATAPDLPKTPPSPALQSGKYLGMLMTHFARLDEVQKHAIVELVVSMAKQKISQTAPSLNQRLPRVKTQRAVAQNRAAFARIGDDMGGGRDGPY